jgi:hypothetical protein
MQINVRVDISRAKRKLAQAQKAVIDKATVSAINKTIAKARTEMVRAVTSEFKISAVDVRGRLRVSRATRNTLTAALDPFAGSRRGRSMNVIRFMEKKVTLAQARKRAKMGTLNQLHFEIKRRGGKKIIAGAFIGNRGRTVFIRKGKERLPIKAVSTIGVPSMFNTRRINTRVAARIRTEFKVELERAIRFHLSKLGG